MSELKAVKSKIAKLMALGQSNSLAEAQVAVQKAGKLMEEWALSIEDIELGDEDIVHETIKTGSRRRPAIYFALVPLAEFTNVKLWVTSAKRYDRNSTYTIHLLGYETDVQLFKHFYATLNHALEHSFEQFKQSREYQNRTQHGKSLRVSFTNGFVGSISRTLTEMVAENKQVVTKTGTALVPLKNGKIEEYYDEKFGMKLRRTYTNTRTTSYEGYSSGTAAGSKVSLNRPVGGQSGQVRRIGKA